MESSEKKIVLNTKGRPFLKWAGGKSQLLPQFLHYYPSGLLDQTITRYIEPFLGGGAVFFDIAQRFPIKDAVLFDINHELILAYRVIQKKPEELISLLREQSQRYYALSEEDRKECFYSIREEYNAQRLRIDYENFSDEWVVRAARIIFLNKTCFNGLFRVNSSGEFNVPFGKYKRPTILDEPNILQVSRLLENAIIRVGSYEKCRRFVNSKSFVYFDPPYRPISSTSSFTSYAKDKFNDADQIKLAKFFSRLHARTDAKLMLSNSDPQNTNPQDLFFEKLYAEFRIHKVFANRMISSNAQGRGKISELLIKNY